MRGAEREKENMNDLKMLCESMGLKNVLKCHTDIELKKLSKQDLKYIIYVTNTNIIIRYNM